MSKAERIVFILWGHHCHEAAATIFVTALREAGLRVKVVGLSGQRIAGVYGLALTPDIMLDQALRLAQRAICVVSPCDAASLRRFGNDPRLGDFLQQAHANHAQFVMGEADPIWLASIGIVFVPEKSNARIVYPKDVGIMHYAQTLAHALVAVDRKLRRD